MKNQHLKMVVLSFSLLLSVGCGPSQPNESDLAQMQKETKRQLDQIDPSSSARVKVVSVAVDPFSMQSALEALSFCKSGSRIPTIAEAQTLRGIDEKNGNSSLLNGKSRSMSFWVRGDTLNQLMIFDSLTGKAQSSPDGVSWVICVQ